MTPGERLDRVERILVLFANSGRRSRSEWRVRSRERDEEIKLLFQAQRETTQQIRELNVKTTEQIHELNVKTIEQIHELNVKTTQQIRELSAKTNEQINKLTAETAANHAIHNKEMADIRRERKLTEQALRAFINGLRKGRNGSSSD